MASEGSCATIARERSLVTDMNTWSTMSAQTKLHHIAEQYDTVPDDLKDQDIIEIIEAAIAEIKTRSQRRPNCYRQLITLINNVMYVYTDEESLYINK